MAVPIVYIFFLFIAYETIEWANIWLVVHWSFLSYPIGEPFLLLLAGELPADRGIRPLTQPVLYAVTIWHVCVFVFEKQCPRLLQHNVCPIACSVGITWELVRTRFPNSRPRLTHPCMCLQCNLKLKKHSCSVILASSRAQNSRI